jgi:hypothetical protein
MQRNAPLLALVRLIWMSAIPLLSKPISGRRDVVRDAHVVGQNTAIAIFEAIIDQLALACGEFNPGFKYDRFRDACYKAAKLPVPVQ